MIFQKYIDEIEILIKVHDDLSIVCMMKRVFFYVTLIIKLIQLNDQ
jgi:hypothetical protein